MPTIHGLKSSIITILWGKLSAVDPLLLQGNDKNQKHRFALQTTHYKQNSQ